MDNLINFIKMQALGNDFIVIDTQNSSIIPSPEQIQALSHRHFGIGFDQMLVVNPSQSHDYDYNYQIFNADGSEVGQCGNGARCAALYIHRYLAPNKKNLILKTKTTTLKLEILDDNLVSLHLPPPVFVPEQIPFLGKEQHPYSLSVDGKIIKFYTLSVGNPHAVVFLDSQEELFNMDISKLGKTLEHHQLFPERCNVNFAYIINAEEIILRVWERGCGETLACGSGALATACVAKKFYGAATHIKVILKGGTLKINWPDLEGPVEQIGPALEVFKGSVLLK
jgi:diaminopimelate epimerase